MHRLPLTELLRALVARHGTQQRAAAALGVSQATYSRWLDGTRTPGRSARQKLMTAGADPATL